MNDMTRPPIADAAGVERFIRTFLAALEARDGTLAQSHMAADARIIVPGGRVVGSAHDIVANSSRRYRAVGKRFERFDIIPIERGHTVYCTGTLHGVWADGTAFEGIRFIDRFDVVDGLIRLQEVWNDAGELRAARAEQAAANAKVSR